MTPPLPYRQVHLDFHTSPYISDLLSEFDAAAFAKTMSEAHVNSVTVFAKCHHGMSYYPTQVGKPHPHLGGRDLLGEMLEALRQRGIRTPIYYTVGWEENLAFQHPEWRQVTVDGLYARKDGTRGLVDPDKWWFMDFLHPDYQAHMRAEVEEICRDYPVDGFFFDIVLIHPNGGFNDNSLAIRKSHGLTDFTQENQRLFQDLAREKFASFMNGVVHARYPDAYLFYNSGHMFSTDARQGIRRMDAYQHHWEIESLPSGFWGYFHFPRFGRYVSTLNKPWVGMTGRFQRMWGDFGGVKPQAALEYECFRSQGHGGGNSIGDQLPPRGKLEPAAYDLIGKVYKQVEDAEPFYEDSENLHDVGIVLASHPSLDVQRSAFSEEGAVLMLEEAHYNPAMVDDASDLSAYAALILPDTTIITDALEAKLKAYYASGGQLILSCRSGFDKNGRWRLGFLPLTLEGPSEWHPTYWRARARFWPDLVAGDRVFYEAGMNVRPGEGVEVLVDRVLPYFVRTDEHFMSHFQAPPVKEPTSYPAVVKGERFVYFADPVFACYRYYGSTFYRNVVERVLHQTVGEPSVGAGLPRGVLCLPRRRQQDLIVTLLHYVPVRKAIEGDVLEEASSFSGQRLYIRGLTPQVKVREFQGKSLPGSAQEGFLLPNKSGRLLLEVAEYFSVKAGQSS